MFLIPLFCLNKYPLANIIKVYNKYKTPNPMVNSNLSSCGLAGPSPEGSDALELLPSLGHPAGEKSKPAPGKRPAAVPPPGRSSQRSC